MDENRTRYFPQMSEEALKSLMQDQAPKEKEPLPREDRMTVGATGRAVVLSFGDVQAHMDVQQARELAQLLRQYANMIDPVRKRH